MEISVSAIESIIGYNMTNATALAEALVASGCGYRKVGTKIIDNDGHKRLALVGECWLKLAIVKAWYAMKQRRVQVDIMLKATISNENLRHVCEQYGIEKYIVTPHGAGGVVSPRHMYDTIEAIIGAVGEDGGIEAVEKVIQKLGLLDEPGSNTDI